MRKTYAMWMVVLFISSCKSGEYLLIESVKGRAVSSLDKKPIGGVKIYVDKNAFNAFDTVLTDDKGRFEIQGMKVKDYKDLKLQKDVSYLFFIEKEGFQQRVIDIRDFKSIKDTVDLGIILMDKSSTVINNTLVGNVYVSDSSVKDPDQIQAIRIDEIRGRTLQMKYKIGAEQFLDADFVWHPSVGIWLSPKPLTYGSHAQYKSGARLSIKENALELQLGDKEKILSFTKLYNKPVDLKTHRDPYYAEDGFSIEKPSGKSMKDTAQSDK
uniref:carboxypeptidase-like regulatory domain-containing protein n=1 Tax=Pedobacter schmidteae TaxID=2201271 RepID=UPI0013CE8A57|nr:carboxypeptidase-like regulatory domain-containing protein [Pedobacter schmidteae]